LKDPNVKQRKRYSPDVRRSMILDSAGELVVKEGVSSITMERIGQYCGISKSLIYNYFESVPDLLQKLLKREYKALRRLQVEALDRSETYEQLVRNTTHVYLSYIDENGPLLERLQADPGVLGGHDPTFYKRRAAVETLAAILMKKFAFPKDLAIAATDISFGIPAAAGAFLLQGEMGLKEVEDLTVTMMIGTFAAVRDEYLIRMLSIKD